MSSDVFIDDDGNGDFPISQWGRTQVTAFHAMGKIPFMANDWKDNVRAAIKRQKTSMKEVSLKAGKGETFVRDMLERHSSPTLDAFVSIARVLGFRVSQLLGESGGSIAPIPVVGIAGAGPDGEVSFDVAGQDLGEAPVPDNIDDLSPDTVAVEVRGNSMRGIAEDGWFVYYDERRDPPTDDLIGDICVVGLLDGRVLIKKLLQGRKKKHFDLESAAAPTMQDQRVEWAARVTSIVPRRPRKGR